MVDPGPAGEFLQVDQEKVAEDFVNFAETHEDNAATALADQEHAF